MFTRLSDVADKQLLKMPTAVFVQWPAVCDLRFSQSIEVVLVAELSDMLFRPLVQKQGVQVLSWAKSADFHVKQSSIKNNPTTRKKYGVAGNRTQNLFHAI